MASRKLLWLLNFSSLVLYAMVTAAIGPSLPLISKEFNLDPSLAGFLVSISSLGAMLSALGGWIADRVGRGLMVLISLSIFGLGSVLMGLAPTICLMGSAMLCMGIGSGFFEAASNAMISDLYAERRGMAVSLFNVARNIGLGLGPPITVFLITSMKTWRIVYLAAAPPIILLATTILFSSRGLSAVKRFNLQRGELSGLLKIMPIAFISTLIVAVEAGLSTWLPSILIDMGADLLEGGLTVGFFWGLMSVGRFIWAFFIDKLGYRKSMLISGILGTLLMIIAVIQVPLQVKMTAWASSGFFLAPLFPALLALMTDLKPEFGGALTGTAFTMGTLGSFVMTWLVGVVAALLGFQVAQYVFPITSLVTIILILKLIIE